MQNLLLLFCTSREEGRELIFFLPGIERSFFPWTPFRTDVETKHGASRIRFESHHRY
jgi:hypothetical protein